MQSDEEEEQYILNEKPYKPISMFKIGADNAPVENGILLELDHSFGHSQTLINNMSIFVSDDNIVYPSGKHLVMYDLNTRKSEFIKRDASEVGAITEMITGFTKKKELMLVIGETMRPEYNLPPQTSVFYPSRSKWVTLSHDHLTPDYTIPVIEVNKRYLITLARAPSKPPVVSYYRIDKS